MNPERLVPIVRNVAIVLVVLAIVSLVAWYFYIGGKQEVIEETSAGRGFGGSIPTFEAPGGSTFGNLLGTLPAQGGSEARLRPRLSQLHGAPVAGFRVSSTSVQYMDRSGYLYTAQLATEEVARTTNTLIPRVARVILGDEGLLGFAYDEGGDISAFAGTLVISTTTKDLPTIAIQELGSSILDATRLGDELVTLVAGPSGGAGLVASAFDSSSPRRLADSRISSWRIAQGGEKRLALVEKSGTGIPASAFLAENEALVPLLRDIPGLSLLLRGSSDTHLYSADTGVLSVTVSHAGKESPVPLRTIADKCAFSPIVMENPLAYCATPERLETRAFTDLWHRGALLTRDSWWRVDSTDGSTQSVFSADQIELPFDVYNPHVDPSGTYIVFQNKYDETLWALRIIE